MGLCLEKDVYLLGELRKEDIIFRFLWDKNRSILRIRKFLEIKNMKVEFV